MNQECRTVESPQTREIREPAISLPVAERQGYHRGTTAPKRAMSRVAQSQPESHGQSARRSRRTVITAWVLEGLRNLAHWPRPTLPALEVERPSAAPP